jgi:hypothetical protein
MLYFLFVVTKTSTHLQNLSTEGLIEGLVSLFVVRLVSQNLSLLLVNSAIRKLSLN